MRAIQTVYYTINQLNPLSCLSQSHAGLQGPIELPIEENKAQSSFVCFTVWHIEYKPPVSLFETQQQQLQLLCDDTCIMWKHFPFFVSVLFFLNKQQHESTTTLTAL